MPAATAPTVRLSARISTDLHAMLKRAAALQGRTMTDFVIAAVQDAARRAIDGAELLRLPLADQECFAWASRPRPRSRQPQRMRPPSSISCAYWCLM